MCRACEVCLFFESYLTLTGDYAGQPFLLMPWTRKTLRDIFGTLEDDGLRQYRDVYLEVAKKNTKTTLCAGLVLFCLSTTKTTGTEVYSAATAKDQAGIVFRAASQMVNANAELSKRLRIVSSSKRILRRDDPSSFYAAISADGDIHDGINPSFVVRDELHRWRTRKALELNEILERGTITRREPMVIDITTAGEVDESPLCWRRHEYAREIQENVIRDKRFYGRIWAADLSKYDWTSREARVAANPSHEDNGGYLKDSVLVDLCVKAQNDPQARADYLRYHLNVWGQKDDRAIDVEKWMQCGGGVDLSEWPEYDYELLVRKWNLLDRPCYAGVDASWTTDLTALALVFPPDGDDELWSFLTFFWMPEDRVKERQRKDKVPYSDWVRTGFIETCSGNAHDYEGIKARVRWAAELFDLRTLAYDPANFRPSAMTLEGEGIEAAEITQRYSQLNEPTKWLLGAYLDRKVRHGNHPVLNWNARCLTLKHGSQGDVMPDKPERLKMSKRIDGISALVTALVPARLNDSGPSIYETRGVLILGGQA
jgi:phage terminase large subunit-like protein